MPSHRLNNMIHCRLHHLGRGGLVKGLPNALLTSHIAHRFLKTCFTLYRFKLCSSDFFTKLCIVFFVNYFKDRLHLYEILQKTAKAKMGYLEIKRFWLHNFHNKNKHTRKTFPKSKIMCSIFRHYKSTILLVIANH